MSTTKSEVCDDQHQVSGDPNSPQTPPGRVLFHPEDEDSKDSKRDASRFLTAKYQKQQMGMIRKRIAIEDWIEEELSSALKEAYDDDDTSLDLDEILNIQGDKERIEYIKEKLSSIAQCWDVASIDTFIEKLIERLQELK